MARSIEPPADDDQDTLAMPKRVRPGPEVAQPQPQPLPQPMATPGPPSGGLWVTSFHFRRSRTYSFVVDGGGRPVVIGSGRYARVFLGEEHWLESLTDVKRLVVIKMLHKNVSPDDANRFRMEKELLERVSGHPNIVEVLASGLCTDPRLPPAITSVCDGEFVILERLDLTLEERLRGSRDPEEREDLLALSMQDRLLRVLDYMLPVASAVEHAHIVKNVAHRDINPTNILIRLPEPGLAGSSMQVRLADFGAAKAADAPALTRFANGAMGTMFFQSPEQETNVLELLVSVQQGSPEVAYFEDFYIDVAQNDTFAVFNGQFEYPVLYTDRARRRIVLATPYQGRNESNVRGAVQKAVGRPADIYSLGALLYYLISGAHAASNPKTLYDAFRGFVEYETRDASDTIESFLRGEYTTMDSIRASHAVSGTKSLLTDRLFSYKHYLDANGEPIPFPVMRIVAKAMIRNKKDSYCLTHDLETTGVTDLILDLKALYSLYGITGTVLPSDLIHGRTGRRDLITAYTERTGELIKKLYGGIVSAFAPKRKP
jgi:serine/threonine protein kinase